MNQIEPNFPADQEVKIIHIDPHRAMHIRMFAETNDDYQKRHRERMRKIKEIENEDRDDFNKTCDLISLSQFGMSALEYMTNGLGILMKDRG